MSRRSTGFLASRSLERRVPLRGHLDNQLASCCIARLLVLATEDTQKAIVTYVESSSGLVPEALNVISTMNGIRSPVATFSRGLISGPAVVIAAHGKKGFRAAEPNAEFSLKLDKSGKNDDPESHESYLKLLVQILASDTGRSEAEVMRWLTQGAVFTAAQAMAHGLVDVVSREPHLPKA
jgi:ATP-dependent Clp endopeptidase proteolytic subunit ClpP